MCRGRNRRKERVKICLRRTNVNKNSDRNESNRRKLSMSCKENKANLTDKRCLFLTGRAIIESKRVSKDGAASASGAPPISGSSALSAEPAARFSASMSRAVNFLVGWGAASDK